MNELLNLIWLKQKHVSQECPITYVNYSLNFKAYVGNINFNLVKNL